MEIDAQMMVHLWEESTEYKVQVSRDFTELKPLTTPLRQARTPTISGRPYPLPFAKKGAEIAPRARPCAG